MDGWNEHVINPSGWADIHWACYLIVVRTLWLGKSNVCVTCVCVRACVHYVPQVALLPGHSVEEGGDDEEWAKPRPIEPGRHTLPLVIGAEVQHGAAQQTGDYPQLQEKAMKKKVHSLPIEQYNFELWKVKCK